MPPNPLLSNPSPNSEKRSERRAIAFLTIVLAPIIAVIVVAGFGFIVWMIQLIAGPPGM